MNPITIPADWDDNALLTFEQFCTLIHTPPHPVRDWRRRGIGPSWARFNGCGRLYITVAEMRHFIQAATVADPRETANRHTAPPNVVDTNGSRG